MRILGANPLGQAKSELRGVPSIGAFPRKSFAAAGYVNNIGAGKITTEVLVNISGNKWKAPPSTNRILSISGYGNRGSTGGVSRTWSKYSETYYYRADGGVDIGNATFVSSGSGYAPNGGNIYCDTEQPSSGVYTYTQKCYFYEQYEEYDPDTYGVAATMFDLTFRGGFGNETIAMSTTTFKNVLIIPNKEYPVLIPTNGRLTLTYTK